MSIKLLRELLLRADLMRGVILAAGPGEALKPITESVSKPMIQILDKPLIRFAIDRLLHSGIKEICIVTEKEAVALKEYIQSIKELADFSFRTQVESGIEGAIKAVSDLFSEDEQFVLTHADIVSNNNLVTRTLNAADNSGAEMALAVALQTEAQDFGQVKLDSNGYVSEVIPDTNIESSSYVVAGTFLLTGKIFNYLGQGFAFNECFNRYIADGGEVAGGIWNETWIDVGHPWDILRATSYLLSKLDFSRISAKAKIGPNVEIIGPVVIEEDAEILNGTIIKGPVYVGKGAFIGNNSLVRDHTAIYNSAKVGMGVEIRSSIIMANSSIARLSYVGASIVGPGAVLHSGSITINTNSPPSPIYIEIDGKKILIPLEKFGAVIGPGCHIGVHSSLRPGTIVGANVIIEPHQIISGRIQSKE